MRRTYLALATCVVPFAAVAADSASIGQIVITAPQMSDPLTVVTDPKAPRQPIPASDGASYLKNIPGFSVSRKGGTDGDPVLRGLGGSRLNILLDDSYILGGCGNRMDPPTAYVYPESYDRVTVLKGPQSVLYGANVAGAVRFERETERFDEPGVRGTASAILGSWGRNDQMADVAAGNPTGYLRAIATRSDADDYEDGDGDEVHSFYTRWSGTVLAGWTPDDATRVELGIERSDGEAAYADRTMDGVEFDRQGYSLAVERENLSPLVERLEFKAYHNYIDHVMDNFSLREPPIGMGGMPSKRVMNPDRTTRGLRLAAQLGLSDATFATVGLDHQRNQHRARMAMSMNGSDPVLGDRMDKASFTTTGLFTEFDHTLDADDRLVVGLRGDRDEAEADQRMTMMDPDGYGGAATGETDRNTNVSGFVRWEHELDGRAGTLFAGLGHAERAPDFWERDRVFGLDPEKNTQLDLGVTLSRDRLRANVALFYAQIDDYILLTDFGNDARNVEATTYGAEADLRYTLSDNWELGATLAYVHGENESDDVPLAQMPPLEATLALDYRAGPWSAGALFRAVDEQDRVDIGAGTIYGIDVEKTPGFGVLSINGGYRPNDTWLITAGIDNLLDKTYAEHIGKGSADAGTVVGLVNEPGRTYWLKATAEF